MDQAINISADVTIVLAVLVFVFIFWGVGPGAMGAISVLPSHANGNLNGTRSIAYITLMIK